MSALFWLVVAPVFGMLVSGLVKRAAWLVHARLWRRRRTAGYAAGYVGPESMRGGGVYLDRLARPNGAGYNGVRRGRGSRIKYGGETWISRI